MPPTGVFVNNLPNGAVAQSVEGTRYYQYGGVCMTRTTAAVM